MISSTPSLSIIPSNSNSGWRYLFRVSLLPSLLLFWLGLLCSFLLFWLLCLGFCSFFWRLSSAFLWLCWGCLGFCSFFWLVVSSPDLFCCELLFWAWGFWPLLSSLFVRGLVSLFWLDLGRCSWVLLESSFVSFATLSVVEDSAITAFTACGFAAWWSNILYTKSNFFKLRYYGTPEALEISCNSGNFFAFNSEISNI